MRFASVRLVAVLLLLVLIAGGAVAWRRLRPVPVTATPVVRGKAVAAVYATGTVEAEDRVTVKAKTSGSIAELLAKEGTVVKRGDLLARIDNPVVAFELKRGKVDWSAASALASKDAPQIAALRAQAKALGAELETAKQDQARLEKLAAGGSAPQADLDRARSRVAQIESTIAANEAQQRALRIDLSASVERQAAHVQSLASRVADTEVRSPIDGVVLTRLVEVGEVVMVNQPLFKVGDTRSLVLEVAVDEADIARVNDGRNGPEASRVAVSLYAFPKEVFRGKVFVVMPDANRERKAFLVKVRLDAPPPGLRSGMSTEVNVIAEERDGALLAPTGAEAGGFVWVAGGAGAQRRKVTTGIRDLLRVEIVEGLSDGELVVVEGPEELREGARLDVSVRPADPMAPMPDQTQPARTAL